MSRLSLLITTDDDVAIPYQYYRCRYTMKTWNVTKVWLFSQTSALCIIAHLLYSRASLIHIHKMPLAVPVSIAELTSVPSLIILPLILFLPVLLHYVAKLDHHFLLGRDLSKWRSRRNMSYFHAEGVWKGMQFDARGWHLVNEQKFRKIRAELL